MCGIAGSYQLDTARPATGDRIGHALHRIAHRGPDDEGTYRNGRAVLGHRRLSIIDTSPAGHQPFTDEGGRYTIAFNGEVFNFQELRAALEREGHAFRSRTDTEVVLRLFALKGPACLHDLNGFFAMAVHDAETDSLFLARDRFGIKPLWWAENDGRFLFASELRALLALGLPCAMDRDSLVQYLAFFFTPAPHGMVAGSRKLLPGHSLTVDAGGVKQHRWYDPVAASARVPRSADPRRTLHDLLDDAVQRRLVSDVPVGTFLSGGVDSSIISALAARHHRHLHTFSIGYKDNALFDESGYAEEVARHIGSMHSTFMLGTEELADGYPRLLQALDEPFADSSALPSFLLCEQTRKHVTVALSGDGADEIFGGYRKHQAELRWRAPGAAERAVKALAPLWRALPRSRNSRWQDRIRQLDRFATMAGTDPAQRFLDLAAFTPRPDAEALVAGRGGRAELEDRERMLAAPLGQLPGMNGALLADMASTLPNDMLHKVDITSMAHALEVRPPFLDRRVVELAFSLPPEVKMRKGSGKWILRETFGHLLPPTVMHRAKKGFEVPLLDLFLGPLHGLVDETLNADDTVAAGLDHRRVQEVMQRLRSGEPGGAQATIHALIAYLSWWKSHAKA